MGFFCFCSNLCLSWWHEGLPRLKAEELVLIVVVEVEEAL